VSSRDVRQVLDIVYLAHADDHPARVEALTRLGRLVGCDTAVMLDVDGATGRTAGRMCTPDDDPLCPDDPDVGHAVTTQHPVLLGYGEGRHARGTGLALSDVADRRALGRLPFYADVYRPAGVHDQLSCVAGGDGGRSTVVFLNRSRWGFRDGDRALVELVTPHLHQAAAHHHRLASLGAAARGGHRRAARLHHAVESLSALTARERQVVSHLADGASDREIARALTIAERTVHTHLHRIYHKLGVPNRSAVIVALHQAARRGDAATA
jgi:DNA-binding CsgD family transcriptional regulator